MKELLNSFLIYFFPSFILMTAVMYGWHKLLNKKIDFKNYKLYILLICITVVSLLNFLITEKFLRVITVTLFFVLIVYFLFRQNIKNSILVSIYHQIIIFFSEFIAVFILSLILGNSIEIFIRSIFGNLLINVFVGIISILIINFKFVLKLFNYVLRITERIKTVQLIIFCLIIILSLNIYVISAYHNIDFRYWISINIILMIVLFIIVLYSIKTQNNFNEVSDQYNVAIKSLNDYETMMTKYRIANHENKNLLLTIRAMIVNKQKDIPKFIDTMIENKYEDDEKLLFDMIVIPSGGLRATIYSEILKIKENNIKYSLNIDKKLKSIDLIKLDTTTIVDICKIIGVFIDNSIDEVKSLRNRNIDISLYICKNKLNIKVSNNYKSKIEIEKINNEGYTTKGKGHGYGLSLVKKIIDTNNLLENKMELSKGVFSQILVIKYKKSH